MYKVKFTPYRKELGEIMPRQTAHHSCVSSDGKYKFYINEDVDDPDFWVVQGKGIRQPETCHVAPENTIFLSTEPRSVLMYPQKYLRQFGLVCTCQARTKHPNLHLAPAVLPWLVGCTEDKEGKCHFTIDYDMLKDAPAPAKTKLISVITSNKAFTGGHVERIEFVKKLKEHYGDKIDVFGRGCNEFDDKWDVLAPYKYHIAIENSSHDYYWSEKISDCYLTETFPIYYGCTNIGDYFPHDAYCNIDIHHFDEAVKIIDRCIANDIYEQRKQALAESKELVLEKYNMFNYIASLCDTLNPDSPKQDITLIPCVTIGNWHNFYNYTFKRSYYKIKQKFIQ